MTEVDHGPIGFTVAAADFYEDLENDNTRSFWTAHKDGCTSGSSGSRCWR